MKNKEEKLVKSRLHWRGENGVKKLHLVMKIIAVFLCISVAAGVFILWRQVKGERDLAARELAQLMSSGTDGTAASSGDAPSFLILVNSGTSLPDGYVPILTEFGGVQVDSRIVPALRKMTEDAKTAGCPLTLTGGYVSAERQDRLYQAEVSRLMSAEKKSRSSAENEAVSTVGRGGSNENQTGFAVEFAAADSGNGTDFSATRQYHWLAANSVSYGFVLRYPADKTTATGHAASPAHFRFVGADNALKMREYSMCLEEYVSYLSSRGNS